MIKVRHFLFSALLCLCLSSCAPLIFFGAGTAAGVSGYKYYRGALNVTYQAPYIKVWDAALTALKGMNLEIEDQKHDLTVGTIAAKRADKKPVRVSIEYKSANETEAVIRVGFFGDKDASILVKEEIGKVLFKE